jgi:hypothetical protein
MKAVHVVPGLYQKASGVSYSVPFLCQYLADRGIDIHLHVLAPPPREVAIVQTCDMRRRLESAAPGQPGRVHVVPGCARCFGC